MNVLVQDGIDEAFFREQVDTVMERLDRVDGLSFIIIAINEPAQCDALLDDIDITDRQAFKRNCEEAITSMSYRAEGQEIIVIKADKDFLAEDAAALRGLIAHETMHTLQRDSGLEEQIQAASEEHVNQAVNDLQARGYEETEIAAFLQTVVSTAIFALKDIYANTALIEQGFAADLERYYYHMLDVDDYCQAPEFYQDEATLEDVQAALQFELGLLPAWLPFDALDREEADDIKERITACYEQNIPDVAETVHRISDVYQEAYGDHDRFNDQFFDQLLHTVYDMLDEKLERNA